jgi:hypothetical protein
MTEMSINMIRYLTLHLGTHSNKWLISVYLFDIFNFPPIYFTVTAGSVLRGHLSDKVNGEPGWLNELGSWIT